MSAGEKICLTELVRIPIVVIIQNTLGKYKFSHLVVNVTFLFPQDIQVGNSYCFTLYAHSCDHARIKLRVAFHFASRALSNRQTIGRAFLLSSDKKRKRGGGGGE